MAGIYQGGFLLCHTMGGAHIRGNREGERDEVSGATPWEVPTSGELRG